MDVLSGILGNVRMNAAIYFDGLFCAPWGINIGDPENYAHALSPGSEHLVSYHLVLEGGCSVQLEGEAPVHVGPGDIILMPHGRAHKIWDGNPTAWRDSTETLRKHMAGELRTFREGREDGRLTHVICGYLGCDKLAGQLVLSSLPPLFVVNVRGDETGRWIESSIRHLVAEATSGRAGGSALLSRMAEALFVESLRRWIDGLPADQTGWLAGTRDPVIGRTLSLIHSEPGRGWTVDDLARTAGASRSVLTERFSRLVGEPPLAYLASVRMQTAARMLESTRKTVVQVAADVGYESEAAFNRAFKRQFGDPPARFRRKARAVEEA